VKPLFVADSVNAECISDGAELAHVIDLTTA
jgi:hypothetical protein